MNQEKWQQYSLYEQLGNILSEISRANNREMIGEIQSKKESLKRVLELIDLTLNDTKHNCNLKEIGILKDIVHDKYTDGNNYDVTFEDIQNYLLPFAILARR